MGKSYLDPTIPLQKEMGDQIYGVLNGSTLEFIRQECEGEYLDDCAKEHRERRGMMIEKSVVPDIYKLCQQAKDAVGFKQNIDFYLVSDTDINAGSIESNDPVNHPHIIELNAGLVNLMSKQELLFVIGHEIGHLINGDGQLKKLTQFIYADKEEDDMPDFVTHVVEVKDRIVMPKVSLTKWNQQDHRPPRHVLSEEKIRRIIDLPYSEVFNLPKNHNADEVIKFDNVCIRYGERTILKDLSFIIHNGEHWALSGENGSGKSTLLSIVCADNPQAYANSITLFGFKRGTGESIWDIKRFIGYISPEMHRAYLRDFPAVEIVASGLRDSVGLYVKPKPEQLDICRFWMDIFGVGQHDKTTFLKLSAGEQRLVLLARAFVKDPALLILDEPLHGLDLCNRRLVKDVIETFCKRKNKTLIMVTHYQDELPDNIDHSIHLKKLD